MLFNRQIQVGIVKKPKEAVDAEQEIQNQAEQAAATAAIISATVESVGKTVLTGLLVYIAADTARKVIIKSTPER